MLKRIKSLVTRDISTGHMLLTTCRIESEIESYGSRDVQMEFVVGVKFVPNWLHVQSFASFRILYPRRAPKQWSSASDVLTKGMGECHTLTSRRNG